MASKTVDYKRVTKYAHKQLIGFRKESVFYYIPKAYQKLSREKWPVFTLSLLTMQDREIMQNYSNLATVAAVNNLDLVTDIVKTHLLNISNFRTARGAVIKFVRGVVDTLSLNLLYDLYNAIIKASMVTAAERIGLHVLAGVTSGIWNRYNCDKCKVTPGLKEKHGCKTIPAKPAAVEEIRGMIYNYWRCPLLYIPPSVYAWYSMYKLYEKHPSILPKYEALTTRYIDAVNCFDTEYAAHLQEK